MFTNESDINIDKTNGNEDYLRDSLHRITKLTYSIKLQGNFIFKYVKILTSKPFNI